MRTICAGYVIVAGIAAFAWTGCKVTGSAGTAGGGEAAETGGSSAREENASERSSLERKLAIAELRLKHARMELEAEQTSSKVAVELAHGELGVVEAKHAQFQKLDMPNRIARGELSLQRARDSAEEAREALEQLLFMYEDQDLQDATKEFVISRGKRRAEQARASLTIQELELEALKNHEVPRELRGLELEVTRKASSVHKAESDAEAGRLQKEIAIMKVESEIADLKDQVAKLDEEGQDG